MKLAIIMTAGLLAVASASFAADTDNEKVFKMLDKNNDGFITKSEVSSVKKLIKDWDSIDTDKNGSIAMSEFSAVKSADAYAPVEEENEPIGAAPTN